MRILLVDKHSFIRSSLRMLIEQSTDHSVVAEVAESENLLTTLHETKPDLVLLEWELIQNMNGELIASLKAENPGLKVVILSGQPSCRKSAMEAGADHFMSKVDPPDRLQNILKSYA